MNQGMYIGAVILPIIVAIAAEEALRRRRNFIFARNIIKKKKGASKMALPNMVKEITGKQVQITTLSASHRGKVADVQDEWIKLVLKNGREVFVKEDMITGILVCN